MEKRRKSFSIILLHHELLESQIEKQYNLNAHDAHDEASKTYDWLGQLHRETSKKGEKGVFCCDKLVGNA